MGKKQLKNLHEVCLNVSPTLYQLQKSAIFASLHLLSVEERSGQGVERYEIAWWAILAKEPACRGGTERRAQCTAFCPFLSGN
jgi:hypothetical protein